MIRFAAKVLLVAGGIFLVTASVCAAQDSTMVILGGAGPTPQIQTVIDGVSDALSSSGVRVKVNSGESKSRSVILDEMKTSGNRVLLYLTVNQMTRKRGKILAESFVDEKKVWEEDTRGSGFSSGEDELHGMLKSINEKIKKHIGGPGLPK